MELKQRTRKWVYGVAVANLGIWMIAAQVRPTVSSLMPAWPNALAGLLPVGFGVVLVGSLVELMTARQKEVLVFRRRSHPLPGSRAFSEHMQVDARVDAWSLEAKHGPFPTSAEGQNTLWYKIYRGVREAPEVMQAHRAYLFARDSTALSVLAAALLGGSACILLSPSKRLAAYLAFLGLQYLVFSRIAQNSGTRFVTTVLAVASHQ